MILRELIGGKYLCDATDIIFRYIVYFGPWVLGWKFLKPSRKTLKCGCMGLVLPLGMSPKRHRVWLALGWCPRIVIIISTVYLVEHWYLIYRLVGVNSLSIVQVWTRKNKNHYGLFNSLVLGITISVYSLFIFFLIIGTSS